MQCSPAGLFDPCTRLAQLLDDIEASGQRGDHYRGISDRVLRIHPDFACDQQGDDFRFSFPSRLHEDRVSGRIGRVDVHAAAQKDLDLGGVP
jgi:hypothetical protein